MSADPPPNKPETPAARAAWRSRAAEVVARLKVLLAPILAWVVGRWRHWRRPKLKIQRPYFNLRSRWRFAAKIGLPLVLIPFGLIYGFFFALTAPYLIVPFAAPVALLLALSVWALPSSGKPPVRTMELFFCSVFVGLILWPNYLALALPGLPWITVIRLTGFPMAALLLVCLSISQQVRSEIWQVVTVIRPLWTLFLAFIALQIIPMPLSDSISASFSRVLVHMVNWTAIFIVAAYVFRKPGRPQFYINLLFALAVPIMVISVLEYMQRSSLWASSVPSFLKVDDPMVQIMLGNVVRSATGLYRAKATFSNPLGLGEFMALLTPFAIHFAVGQYRPTTRVFAVIALPLIFYVIRLTDARLGVVGFLVSFLVYLLFWGLLRFKRRGQDLISSVLVYAYPAVFTVAVTAVMTIQPLNVLVFGGGAQSASNWARQNQLKMGIPKILQNPIGHGAGGSGEAMGYAADQFVAVDNYYLTLGLDYGVMGTMAFVGMFAVAIIYGSRTAILATKETDKEVFLLIPLATCFCAFLIIKSVFSQEDNHPLLFMMLGMVAALVHRVRSRDTASANTAPVLVERRGKTAKARRELAPIDA